MGRGRSCDRSVPTHSGDVTTPLSDWFGRRNEWGTVLEGIVAVVPESFGTDPSRWSTARRIDDGSRAVAAFLARRKYGYRAGQVAEALGYASHGGVVTAIGRIENAGAALRRRLRQLEKMLTND